MSMRYPGGLIATSPVNARYPSGVWTQAQAAPYQAQNVWTRDQFWPNTTLLLQGDGATNGAQNNTFLDSSSNNFTITRNGNTTQGAFTPYEQDGYWSNYFDGSGDYLTTPSNTAFAFGTGDFTVEAFVFITATNSQNLRVFTTAGVGSDFAFEINTSLQLAHFNGSTTLTLGGSVPLNQWVHIAWVRSGSTVTGYINGVSIGTATSSANMSNSQTISIGATANYTSGQTAYISNLRVVKGTAVYTSAFTPSTAPLTAITNTSLLTCQSNRFKDNSTNNFTLTVNGDTSVQAFQPFPGATTYSGTVLGGSGYFDGTGDYLSDIGTTSSFNFLHNTTALFTFECWVYIPSTAAEQYLFDNTNGTSSQIGCSISIVAGGAVSLFITRGVTGVGNVTAYVTSTGTVPTNQWVHIAVTYDQSLSSNNAKFYINGAAAGSGNKTGNTPSSSNASNTLRIGTFGAGAGAFITGYISNLRISNSIVYSSAFTPPTAPVTGGALLTNFTNAGIYDNSMMNNLETVGNAQVSTSVVKYGTGSMLFNGSSDYLVSPNNPAYDLGTGDFTIELFFYPTSLSGTRALVTRQIDPSSMAMQLRTNGTSLQFVSRSSDGSGLVTLSGGTVSLNTWSHAAVVKNGTAVTLYLNGTSVATATSSNNLSGAVALYVAVLNASGIQNYFSGYIDDLRITKGVARYIGNFTPPPARLPAQ